MIFQGGPGGKAYVIGRWERALWCFASKFASVSKGSHALGRYRSKHKGTVCTASRLETNDDTEKGTSLCESLGVRSNVDRQGAEGVGRRHFALDFLLRLFFFPHDTTSIQYSDSRLTVATEYYKWRVSPRETSSGCKSRWTSRRRDAQNPASGQPGRLMATRRVGFGNHCRVFDYLWDLCGRSSATVLPHP